MVKVFPCVTLEGMVTLVIEIDPVAKTKLDKQRRVKARIKNKIFVFIQLTPNIVDATPVAALVSSLTKYGLPLTRLLLENIP